MHFLKFFVLSLFISLSVFVNPVSAVGEFDTSFISEYQVTESDMTRVSHHITITNKLGHIYLTNYTISLGATELDSLEVLVNGKKNNFRQDKNDSNSVITIPIANPVIGKDQELTIDIFYDSDSLVETLGSVREINIPRMTKANEAKSYLRRVIVPHAFGTPSIESPHSTSVSENDAGDSVYEYVGFPTSNITLLFGGSLGYDVSLKYTINNPTISTADTEIAIPPDTEYQKVILKKIDPQPERIKLDEDGNWLAVYSLKSQESLEISSDLYIEVHPEPTFPSLVADFDKLVRPAKYWESKSETVSSLAESLKSPLNIYNYLIENFEYDYSKVASGVRIGAEKSLGNPSSAICTEYTDSFIALARALKIPAREINGYARGSDNTAKPSGFSEDILHSWPEYYDYSRSTWVQIDPTWGDTTGGIDYFQKLDYDHLTFVRHGRESEYPYPAGSYKSDPLSKSIDVQLASSIPESFITFTENKIEGGVLIRNTGNTSMRDYDINISNGTTYRIDYLPPLGEQKISPPSNSRISFLSRFLNFFRSLW